MEGRGKRGGTFVWEVVVALMGKEEGKCRQKEEEKKSKWCEDDKPKDNLSDN